MKLVVYDDSSVFGGHQIMAVRGIEALAADPANDVTVFSDERNAGLHRRLQQVPRLHLRPAPRVQQRLQGLRAHINRNAQCDLAQQFAALNPDRVLCIQGDIEHSALGVLAAERTGIDCISYLAVAHRCRETNARAGRLRDLANRQLLNRPDRYITVAECMKQKLIDRGVTRPITVVPNGIAIPRAPHPERPDASPVLGLVGRVEFNQKAQDFMMETFCRHADAFRDCSLLVVGSGPDEKRLRRMAATCPRRDVITIRSWQEDMDAVWAEIDFLMLPSRYEGMPLVMLEALARGIPVIGSACDGMAELLPPSWLFEPGSADELATTFAGVRHIWQHEIAPLCDKVRSGMTIEAFQTAFCAAVVD